MPSPPSIPDHTLRRPIGRGAYGEVWLARNVMGAPRAVKIVWRQQFESDRPYEREFAGIQRYEPVSRSADGLVHVLHVGRNDAKGYFYYVMELADAADPSCEENPGASAPIADSSASRPDVTPLSAYAPRTLRSDLKRLWRLPTADCLRLALDVISGLARLHHQGLVHRDVKPGNIIFVNGRAKLADIGLVSTGGEARTFVGTEGYIPPEGPGSPAADLYALGVVLYEASTGFSPERFPDVPSDWLLDEAGDDALELHEVILKACEGQRERRYESAEAMQADLALLQSGQSVRRVRALEWRVKLFWRWGFAAALLVLLAMGTALISNWRAEIAEKLSAKEAALRTRAEAAERDSRERLHAAYLAEARATVQSGAVGRRFRTLEAVRQAAAFRVTPELRGVAFAALGLPDLRAEREIDLGPWVNTVSVDPAFARYAISPIRTNVEIHSLSDQSLLQTLTASTNLNAQVLRFSPDGRYLAFKRDHGSGGDSDLEVWNLATTQRVVLARHAVAHTALSFHPHLPRLLAGRPSGRLVAWDLEKGTELTSWRLPPHWCVRYSPDGKHFALSRGGRGGAVVEIHDADSGDLIRETAFTNQVSNLEWHPNGQTLGVPCHDGTVNLLDAQQGTVRTLGLHRAQAIDVDFTADGSFLFSRGWDRELNIWNLRNFQLELSVPLGAEAVQIGADGRRVVLCRNGRRLQWLEFSPSVECRELTHLPEVGVFRGSFSDDGRWFAVSTRAGTAVWDLAGTSPPATIKDRGLASLVFAPRGDELFGMTERRLFRWRLVPGSATNSAPTLEPLPVFQPKRSLYSLHLLRGAQALLFSGVEGLRMVPFTNVTTGEGRLALGPFRWTSVSRDEKWFAVTSPRDPGIAIFRLPELVRERWLTNSAGVRAFAFALNHDELAVLTETNLCLWDTTTWQLKKNRTASADPFSKIAYAPDGRTILVSENARTSAVLDATTLEPLLPLPVWTHPLAISADNRHLAIAVEGRRVQLWDLATVRARFRELGLDWKD